MGDRMAAKQLTINKLLAPLFWFAGYRRDYFESGAFAEDMAEKMASVPHEELVSPAPNVAAQAMEGLSYSLDEPDLKEMYLNLLATASDRRNAAGAHPSYASVIRQLSAEEASLLPRFLANRAGEPMAEIRMKLNEPKRGFHTLTRHVVDLRSPETSQPIVLADWPIYVDNWVRLGLVEADYLTHRVAEDAYDFVRERDEFTRLEVSADESYELAVEKGLLKPTDFGTRFRLAVLPPTEVGVEPPPSV